MNMDYYDHVKSFFSEETKRRVGVTTGPDWYKEKIKLCTTMVVSVPEDMIKRRGSTDFRAMDRESAKQLHSLNGEEELLFF